MGGRQNVDHLARLVSENIQDHEHKVTKMVAEVDALTRRVKYLEGRLAELNSYVMYRDNYPTLLT